MEIEIKCSCGKMFRVKDEMGGKVGKCPSCGSSVAVPLPDTAISPASETVTGATADAPSTSDEHACLDGAPGRAVYLPRRCPICGTRYPESTLVCMDCGIDLARGLPLEKPRRQGNAESSRWSAYWRDIRFRGLLFLAAMAYLLVAAVAGYFIITIMKPNWYIGHSASVLFWVGWFYIMARFFEAKPTITFCIVSAVVLAVLNLVIGGLYSIAGQFGAVVGIAALIWYIIFLRRCLELETNCDAFVVLVLPEVLVLVTPVILARP